MAMVIKDEDRKRIHAALEIHFREQFDIAPALITGPATDNAVGIDQITERLSLPAINALTNGVVLGDAIAAFLGANNTAATES